MSGLESDESFERDRQDGGNALRLLIERMPDGIVVVDEAGVIRFANPAAQRLFGRTAEELVGGAFGFPVTGGETTEVELIRRGGELVTAELRVVQTSWESDAAWIVSLRDISDRKEAEERAKELVRAQAAQAEAEAAERRFRLLAEEKAAMAEENAALFERAQEANRAKSEFLAVMSHELRTPLNAVMGYTELLMSEVSGPILDAQREQLGRIKANSRHLLELVDDILSFAKLEDGRDEIRAAPIDFREVVKEVSKLAAPLAEQKDLKLRIDLSDSPCEGVSDADKVRQILLNLVSNAIKFTEDGEVLIGVSSEHDEVVLYVEDCGIGIPAERLDQIWQPFWQVEQSRTRTAGGTGLGLSVVRRLAELLGGKASVESTVGKGTTFTVRLPIRV